MKSIFPLVFRECTPVSCCCTVIPLNYRECALVLEKLYKKSRYALQLEHVNGEMADLFGKLDPLGPAPNRGLVVNFRSNISVIFNNGYPAASCYLQALHLCRGASLETYCLQSQPTIRFNKQTRMLAGLQFASFVPKEQGEPTVRGISLTQESQKTWKFSESGTKLETEMSLYEGDTRNWFQSTEVMIQLMRALGYPVDDETAYGPEAIAFTIEGMAKMPQHSMSLVQRYLRGENVEWSGSGGIG